MIPAGIQAIVDSVTATLATQGIRGKVDTMASTDGQHVYLSFMPAVDLDPRIRGAETTGNNALRYALLDAGFHADDPSGMVRVWLPRAADPAATLNEAVEASWRDASDHLAHSPRGIVPAKMPHQQPDPVPSTFGEQEAELHRLFASAEVDVVACDRIIAICEVCGSSLRRRVVAGFERRGLRDWAEKARATERKAA